MSLVALLAAPPLDPSREVAREWARAELSDPVYANAQPGLVQRAAQWVLDHLSRLELPARAFADPRTGLVLLALVVLVVGAVVLLRTGRLRGPGRSPHDAAVFDDVVRTAAEHRHLADQAAAQGRWDDAVRERFRAVVRSLEERVVLDERPGRTADEAATDAGPALPALADRLLDGARLFDDVSYGDRPALAVHDEQLRALDRDVAAARPVRPADLADRADL
ncbi:DUF4129 domain-containing protein, partial [Angustibacter peucedani]